MNNLPSNIGRHTVFRDNPYTHTYVFQEGYILPAVEFISVEVRNQSRIIAGISPTVSVDNQRVSVTYTPEMLAQLPTLTQQYILLNSEAILGGELAVMIGYGHQDVSETQVEIVEGQVTVVETAGFSLVAEQVDIATEKAEAANIAAGRAEASATLAISGSQRIAALGGSPEDGVNIYNVSTAGTYTNFSGVVVSSGDLAAGLVQLRKNNNVWSKFIVPIPLDNYAEKALVQPILLSVLTNSNGEVCFVDANGEIAFKIGVDGKAYFGQFASKNINLSTLQLLESSQAIFAIVDSLGNVAMLMSKEDFLLRVKGLIAETVACNTLTAAVVNADTLNLKNALPTKDPFRFVWGDTTDIVHLISYGQSNATGGGAVSILTSAPKYGTLMPYNGRQASPGGNFTSFLTFRETVSESPLSGMSEKFVELIEDENFIPNAKKGFDLFVSTPGQGSTNIAGLSKAGANVSGQTYNPYGRLIYQVTQAKVLADAAKKSFSVGYIAWIQGENDNASTYGAYQSALLALMTDLNTDISAITGQKNTIPFIGYQITYNVGGTVNEPSKVLLDFGLTQSNYVCACPTYQMYYDIEGSNFIHLTAQYRRIMGAYLSIAGKRTIVDGRKFLPLHINRTAIEVNTLKLYFHVPVKPLVFDVTELSNPGDYGFEVYSSASAKLTLSNIKIIGSDCISIDCSASPSGGRITYANQIGLARIDETPDVKARFGARGNLRDSAGNNLKIDNYPLHNWMVRQYITL